MACKNRNRKRALAHLARVDSPALAAYEAACQRGHGECRNTRETEVLS